jgi:hypothetical protein
MTGTMIAATSVDSIIDQGVEKDRCYQHQESDLSVLTSSTDPLSIVEDDLTMTEVEDDSDDSDSLITSREENVCVSINSTVSLDLRKKKSETFTATSSGSTSAICARTMAVSFGTISIREYERIAGDHPETTMGVPLGIGWKFYQQCPVEVDVFETKHKKSRRRYACSDGLTDEQSAHAKRVDPLTRKKLLLDVFQVPLEDIRMAEADVKKFRKGVEKRKQQEQKRRKALKEQGVDPNEIEDDTTCKQRGLCKIMNKGTKTLRKLWG